MVQSKQVHEPVMTGSKTCIACGIVKPVTKFHTHQQMADGRLNKCTSCQTEAALDWRRRNPDRHNRTRRRRELMSKYGITLEEYERMYSEQGGKCASCSCALPVLLVDHDHLTGRVRKLLCNPCNRILGIAREDASILRAVATYAERECF